LGKNTVTRDLFYCIMKNKRNKGLFIANEAECFYAFFLVEV